MSSRPEVGLNSPSFRLAHELDVSVESPPADTDIEGAESSIAEVVTSLRIDVGTTRWPSAGDWFDKWDVTESKTTTEDVTSSLASSSKTATTSNSIDNIERLTNLQTVQTNRANILKRLTEIEQEMAAAAAKASTGDENTSPAMTTTAEEALIPPGIPESGEPTFTKEQFTRFEIELEFVQALSNPNYVSHLANSTQPCYFSDPRFIAYLSYLQYWTQPPYLKFLHYPGPTLKGLELLQNEKFRAAIGRPDVAATLKDALVEAGKKGPGGYGAVGAAVGAGAGAGGDGGLGTAGA